MQSDSGAIQRFTIRERLVHWTVGFGFVYLMLTGLSFFSPHLFWLSYVLGGGMTVARWHPIIGVIFSAALVWMFVMWLGNMKFRAEDRQWLRSVGKYIRNDDEGLPEVGRFNPGQKQLFWLQAVCGVLLLLSGVPLWYPHSFPQWSRLISILVHEVAALGAIGGFLVHIYMGTAVVRGSLSAMIHGTVSRRWAKTHHPRWYREMEGEK